MLKGLKGNMCQYVLPNSLTYYSKVENTPNPRLIHGGCYIVMLVVLFVSTHLKNISQIGNLPQTRVKINNL